MLVWTSLGDEVRKNAGWGGCFYPSTEGGSGLEGITFFMAWRGVAGSAIGAAARTYITAIVAC